MRLDEAPVNDLDLPCVAKCYYGLLVLRLVQSGATNHNVENSNEQSCFKNDNGPIRERIFSAVGPNSGASTPPYFPAN